MTGTLVAAALLSAFLHAAWNAAVKASHDPQGAMAAQVVTSGLVSLPMLLVAAPPAPAALPWLMGSAACNVLVLWSLLRGYASGGGFGLVYPTARAVSPLLVLLLARAVHGEALSPYGIAGVALVSGGVALFARPSGGEGTEGRHAALGWALLAGAASAAYVICDSQGVRLSPSAAGYGFAASLANAVVFGGFYSLRGGGSLPLALRRNALVATVGSAAAMVSYLLILWVWSRAPVAAGSALRDTSVVFAALIATMVLHEPLGPRRMCAILLATVGACALRFA